MALRVYFKMPPINSNEDTESASGIDEDEMFNNDHDTGMDFKCDYMCGLLNRIDDGVNLFGLVPLCIIGIIFNFASIGALFNNKLHLRKSLIQLFIFLNSSDV